MEKDREILSAVVDGEHQTADGAAINRLTADDDTRAAWSRYHLIGDVIRDSESPLASSAFTAQVNALIDDEPTVLAPRASAPDRKRQWVGFAIAASVAAMAIVGVRQLSPETTGAPASPAVAVAPATAPAAVALDAQPAVAAGGVPAPELVAQRRLNSYLVKFNEQRSSMAVPGVNPYVRIVGFENE